MPKWLHNKLKKQASKQGLTGERKDAYVYGTLNKYEKSKKRKKSKGGLLRYKTEK